MEGTEHFMNEFPSLSKQLTAQIDLFDWKLPIQLVELLKSIDYAV